jgi:energy-coupling factor transporter transmembrane protein EcfT
VLALGAATVAVPPEALNRAMERSGLPASLARAAGLALRLVPDVRQDAGAMRDALKTRGVDTGSIEGASQTLVPLAARSLDRAAVAEEALLVRGFDPARRETGWPPAAWLALAGLIVAGLVAFLGPGRPAFYATVSIPTDGLSMSLVGLTLAAPAVLVGRVPTCSS